VGVAFSVCCARYSQASPLECIDQHHFAETKIGYISLPSNLNAIIGTSYYCVIQKVVILHDAIKTIQNGVFVVFIQRTKPVSLKKTKNSD